VHGDDRTSCERRRDRGIRSRRIVSSARAYVCPCTCARVCACIRTHVRACNVSICARTREEDAPRRARACRRVHFYVHRHACTWNAHISARLHLYRDLYTRAVARAPAPIRSRVHTRSRAHIHLGALHLAGAHIIAGIHNADVFMALTRLFLVRCRPRPTPPRPCPYPSCNHK